MTPRDELPPGARTAGWIGGALFWVVLLSLVFWADMLLMVALLVSVLLVVVPSISIAQVPLAEGIRIERLPAYWGSIAGLWLLGTACWLVGSRTWGSVGLGLVALPPLALLAWSAGLTLAGLATILLFRAVAIRTGANESALLRELLPRTGKEKAVFALLSLAAGLAEELAYRAYAIPVLAPLLGAAGAAVLTSVVFGALHAYQGWLGIVRTGTMGGLLAWGFLASGSVVPGMVAHAAIDLLAGIVLGDRLLPPERGAGVVGAFDARSPETES